MLTPPTSIRSVLAIVGILVAAMFVVLGYGMILLPMGLIVVAVMLGAAGAMFGSR